MNNEHDDNELDELFSFGTTSPRRSTNKEGAVVLNNDTHDGEHDDDTIATILSPPDNSRENSVDRNIGINENQEQNHANHDASNAQQELFCAAGQDPGSRDFLEWLDAGDDGDCNNIITSELSRATEDIATGFSKVVVAKEHMSNSQINVIKGDSFDFESDIWGANSKAKETEASNIHQDDKKSDIASLSVDFTTITDGANVDATKPFALQFDDDGNEQSVSNNGDNGNAPTPISSPFSFSSLHDALLSTDSTAAQLRGLMNNAEQHSSELQLSAENRKHLYVKLLCNNKTFDEVKDSSLAFSYMEWSLSSQHQQHGSRFHEQATILSQELYPDDNDDDRRQLFCSDLISLLTFYNLRTINVNSSSVEEENDDSSSRFLPTVAALLLFILESASVTSVVLQSFLHVLVPILPLTSKEQVVAAQYLAKYWYLLCLFHIPVVVMHLDRYLPGWYCPKINIIPNSDKDDDVTDNRRYKKLETKGVVPPSCFIAYFAGILHKLDINNKHCCFWEDGFPLQYLIHLWDMVLLQPEGRLMSSLKFFIALQILEQRAHDIMQIRDSDLLQDFLNNQVFPYFSKDDVDTNTKGGTNTRSIVPFDDNGHRHVVYEFINKALVLQESTPVSFLSQLSTLDDAVVRSSLRKRERLTLSAIKYQLEEESQAYIKREEDRKKEEERQMNKLIKEKLWVYYQTYNPEKVSGTNLDLILNVYKGKIDYLNVRLAEKYGAGFLTTEQVQKIMSKQQLYLRTDDNDLKSPQKLKDKFPEAVRLMRLVHSPNNQKKRGNFPNASDVNNQGLAEIDEMLRKLYCESSSDEQQDNNNTAFVHGQQQQVALQVAPAEVLPHICASKHDSSSPLRRSCNSQVKFFLIDSRPIILAKSQGRFPTAANLPPETLLDPDLIQREIERFESFRGSVHLVIMGEGIGAISSLYNHVLTAEEQKLAQKDYSRTELCALFFIKRGFPYVAILEGGFAAAYSFLYREKLFQLSEVLVDYEENVSIWSKLEKAHENPLGEISKQITALINGGLKRINQTTAAIERFAGENFIVESSVNRAKPTNPRQSLAPKKAYVGISPKFIIASGGADGGAFSDNSEKGEKAESLSFSSTAALKSSSNSVERTINPWNPLKLRSNAIKPLNSSGPVTNTTAAPLIKNRLLFSFQQNLFSARKVAASASNATIDPEKAPSAENRQSSFLSRLGSNSLTKRHPASKSGDVNADLTTPGAPLTSRVSRNFFLKNDSSEETIVTFDIGDVSDEEEQS